MPYLSPPTVLPGNILTVADSDFEVSGFTWAVDTNASAPSRIQTSALSGSSALGWSAVAAGDSIISTGFYPCLPGKGYDISGSLVTISGAHDSYIGVRWYDVNHLHISDSWGNDFPTTINTWQPFAAAVTSPSNAAYFKVAAWVSTNVGISENFAIDLMYATQANIQVMVDWVNPSFLPSSQAGGAFMDLTPWVRLGDGVSVTRGRQDSISEMQPGSSSFSLQNDLGWFTKFSGNTPANAYGGVVDLGARCQVNFTDQAGNWWTRFDGPLSSIDYTFDSTGNTNVAKVQAADVLAWLNRQGTLQCWTKQAVLRSGPWLHWTLNDPNNAGSLGNAAETGGNNGPALHPVSATASANASIQWGNTNSGVEVLADAVGPTSFDMSDMWPAGSVTSIGAQSTVNNAFGTAGLESGNVGPYTTPLPSAYFSPVITTTGSAQNTFLNSSGYALVGTLSPQAGYITPSTGNNYSVELWFAADPGVWQYGSTSANTGPFTCFSLGSSRSGSCLTAGLYPSSGTTSFLVGTYPNPPAFSPSTWGGPPPTQGQKTTGPIMSEKHSLPHHLVLNITGANSGATCHMYQDGVDYGTFTLPAGISYDTIVVGGAYGGFGNWFGNVSLVSCYQRLLSQAEIQQHFYIGQFGMWERTTDDCVAQLGQYAGIPPFWNGLSAQAAGLSLTDYYDITNYSPLAIMQLYEQAEQGLLYVPANGALSFATRDWRMGYGAPDVQLPPDVYTPDLGYQLVDQYLLNAAQVGTQTYPAGVSWGNNASISQYGTYSNGGSSLANWNWSNSQARNTWNWVNATSSSGAQLPIITWNRAYASLGLPQYKYWPDPALTDNAAWQVNSKAQSKLTFGSVTVDLLTIDALSGITPSQLYALDIGRMIALMSYDAMVLSYNPVSYYPLDDGIGADLAGNGGTLTLSGGGAATFGAGPSPVASSQSCASFNGTGYLLSTYAPSGGSAWTADCWLNMKGTSPSGSVFLLSSGNPAGGDNAGFDIYLGAGGVPAAAFGNGTAFGQVTASAALSTTGWHHLCATWNGSTVTLYADGQSVGTAPLSGTLAAAGTKTITIGDVAGGGPNSFNGLIGQCAVTPVCLTAAQVLGRFQAAANSQPASLANAIGANELFLEGVTETRSLSQWTWGAYVSPASTQRAWIPGHPVYGQLGATSRIGVSAPDLSTPPAIGKDVAHDAGAPFWPPQFQTTPQASIYRIGSTTVTGTSMSVPVNYGIMHSYQGDALVLQVVAPATATVTAGPDTQGNAYTQVAAVTLPNSAVEWVFVSTGCKPLNSTDSIPVTMSVSQSYTALLAGVSNALTLDTTHTASGTSTTPNVTTGTMSQGYELEMAVLVDWGGLPMNGTAGWTLGADANPGGGSNYSSMLYKQAGNTTASDTFPGTYSSSVAWAAVMLTFKVQPVRSAVLNNPANNGHGFIGALEMRGLHDNLAMALQPPMAVVSVANHSQTIPTGNNSNPVIVWDNIYADTQGGMSAVPGYPNWYTCLVPGFYELSGDVHFNGASSGDVGVRTGYFAVAQQAAQAVAAGTANPTTVASYVCPVGEEHQVQNFNEPPAMNPVTRVYLGIGDMVALCATSNQGGNDTLGTWFGGSQMSIRWCGWSTLNDQVMINTTLGGSGSVTQLPSSGPASLSAAGSAKRTYTTTWTANATYSYYGTSSTFTPQLRATNGNVWQGQGFKAGTGSQFSYVVFPYATIQSALSGASIIDVTIGCSNLFSWYPSGSTLMVGYSTRTAWPSSITPSTASGDFMNFQQFQFRSGQARAGLGLYTIPVPSSLGGIGWGSNFGASSGGATSLIIGDNQTTSPVNYGYWGGPSTWTITVTYTK